MPAKRKAALVILDGFGLNEKNPQENAVKAASAQGLTPTFDKLFSQPYAALGAAGRHVGLPDGQIGNSEVGHMTLGLGRVIRQSMVRIDDAFASGEYAANPVFRDTLEHVRKNGSALHVFTLFGTGGVHAHSNHLVRLLPLTKGLPVSLHLFGDGRDVDPRSFAEFLPELESAMAAHGSAAVSTVAGRYWGMDRDKNWERNEKAYAAIVSGAPATALSLRDYVAAEYAAGRTDEFIEPAALPGARPVKDGDAVIFLNYRSDRAKQVAAMFCDPASVPEPFGSRLVRFANLRFVATTRYSKALNCPVLFADEPSSDSLGEWAAKNGVSQLHVAETEKYAHVTKFFNGGLESAFDGEKDILVASHKVATFDLDPEMSVDEIWGEFEKALRANDLVVCNYANGDMVGHTGSMPACVRAVAKLDRVAAKTVALCSELGADLFLTADHGNCEEMGTPENPKTNHTLNPVPFWMVRGGAALKPVRAEGGLRDVAPTVCASLGLPPAPLMSGKSLLAE